MKFIKTNATGCVLWPSDSPKIVWGRGSAPDPAGRAYDAPQDSLVGWGGGHPSLFPTPIFAYLYIIKGI